MLKGDFGILKKHIMIQNKSNGKFVHTVFFWLHHPESRKDRDDFEKSLIKFLNSSEYISTKHIGTPASTNRQVIDNTYTYCLMVTFESKGLHDKYQEEQVHKTFIAETEHLWKKVLIYDSENILP